MPPSKKKLSRRPRRSRQLNAESLCFRGDRGGRLSALTWSYSQRRTPLDRKDRHIATVFARIRNAHPAPPD